MEGIGGGGSSGSLSLLPLNRRMNPLFLCFNGLVGSWLTGAGWVGVIEGSESRRESVMPTMDWNACLALVPVLIVRPRL